MVEWQKSPFLVLINMSRVDIGKETHPLLPHAKVIQCSNEMSNPFKTLIWQLSCGTNKKQQTFMQMARQPSFSIDLLIGDRQPFSESSARYGRSLL